MNKSSLSSLLLWLVFAAHGGAQTFTLPAVADTYLKSGSANQNRGSDTTLQLAHDGHVLVRFDQNALASTVGSGRLVSASLELFVHSANNNWGADGHPVEAHRLTADWTEAGATWNCAIDTNPVNSKQDCSTGWTGGTFDDEAADTVLQTKDTGHWLQFDVTADVAAFLAGTSNQGWLIEKSDDDQGGKVEYTSREGTAAERPRLVLLIETAANDQVPPVLAITSPNQPILVNEPSPTVTLEYSDGGSGVDLATLQVQIDGQDITARCTAGAQSASCPTSSLAAGNHTIQASLHDRTGNAAQASFAFQLLLGPGPHLVILQAIGDTYLRKGDANKNFGTEPIVRVRESGSNRTLVQFDTQSLATSLTGATLVSASLELHIEKNGRNWGKQGRTVDAHRLTSAWTETGATWNCPSDSNPTNGTPDCATQWAGGSFASTSTASVLHTKDLAGWVSFDVTADVAALPAGTSNFGWLLKKTDETKSGRVDYDSRQGTPGEGPRLVVVFTTATVTDTTPPTITITAPVDGSFVTSATPTISASYSDTGSGINTASVRLELDGVDRTAEAQVTVSGLTFTSLSSLAEGHHAAIVTVRDGAGNVAQATLSFNIDAIAPAVAITAPAQGGYLSQVKPLIAASFSEAGSGLDIASAHVSIDGNDAGGTLAATDSGIVVVLPSPPSDGPHTLTISVHDRAGNEGRATISFIHDSTSPVITITAPATEIVTGNPRPQILAALSDATAGIDTSSAAVLIDDVDIKPNCIVTTSSLACEPAPLVEGLHHLRINLADQAGNPAVADMTFRLVLDLQPPVITITSPAPDSVTRETTVSVTGTVTDDGTVASVVLGSSPLPFSNGSFSGSASLTEGPNRLVVTATDATGKRSTSTISVRRDTTAPRLSINSPHTGQLTNQAEITVEGTALDENGVTVQVNGQPVTLEASRFKQSTLLQEGHNSLTVIATDGVGNQVQQDIDITRFSLPSVQITSPDDLSYISSTTISVSGTLSDPTATVTVNGKPANVSGGGFSVSDVPLVEGGNTLTATATDARGHIATHSINIVRDLEAPHITIYTPQEGAVVATPSVTVAGLINDIVAGTVNATEATVTVNGRPTTVANRSFLIEGVPLTAGDNVITAQAVDASGNQAETSITVHLTNAPGPRLSLVSGNNQSGTIGALLSQPLVVALMDASGQPWAGQAVIFRIRSGNGTLGGGKRQITVTTGADGHSATPFTLGTRAGAATQLVDAEVVGLTSSVTFTESALHGTPTLIVVDSGDQQLGVTGQLLPRPLVAAVTDRGFNRLGGVPVTFKVVKGEGRFENGSREATITTDSDGRAIVTSITGPEEGTGNNVVEARIAALPDGPLAGFTATAWPAGDPAATTIHGVVLDNSNQPVPGVTLRLRDTSILTQSDSKGLFRISPAPVGRIKLIVDGSTAQRPGAWPDLEFELTTIAGRDNDLGMPIYLLPLDLAHGLLVDETHGGTLILSDLPGFSLQIQPGSATFPSGSKSGVVSVTIVHSDKVPMVPNFGQQPRFIVTIQPPGTRFDPPARMSLPNVEGLAPGEVSELYSFDHDLGHFVSIGPATVSEDGSVIVSNPGVGVLKAGWHCYGNPGLTGTPHDCPICNECIGDYCFSDDSQVPPQDPTNPCTEYYCSGGGPATRINDNATPPQRSEHDCLKQICKGGYITDDPNVKEVPDQVEGNCQDELCGEPFQFPNPFDAPPGKACCQFAEKDQILPQAIPYDPSSECCEPKGVFPKFPPLYDPSVCPDRVQANTPHDIDGCSLEKASDIADILAHYPFLNYSGDPNNPAGGPDTAFGSGNAGDTLPCNDHDICYQTCTTEFFVPAYFKCNQQMFADMIGVCDRSQASPSVRENCYAWALEYQGFLTAAGFIAFKQDQQKYCQCCQ
ncbi:MAG: DNRLRE domain-containing protein [Thermoanaerobaculia bacterium]